MSSMAPEAPPAPVAGGKASSSAAGRNPLKRKIGPLPTWAWVAILAAVIVAWAYWKNRTSSANSSSGTSSSGAPSDTTDASQVPQFVNQTFTTVTPPTAPNPVPGPAPGPVPAPPGVPGGVGIKTLIVPRAMTLAQYAKERHWTPTTLAVVEQMNNLKPGSRLKKGQKIKRPWAPEQPSQPPLTGS